MRVLVTGATGYIGGRLVPRLLAAGHDVRCLARTPSRDKPCGLLGLASWYALYPLHQVVFSRLIDAIRRRAEAGTRP